MKVNEVEFNSQFVSRMIPKLEWSALVQAAEGVRPRSRGSLLGSRGSFWGLSPSGYYDLVPPSQDGCASPNPLVICVTNRRTSYFNIGG